VPRLSDPSLSKSTRKIGQRPPGSRYTEQIEGVYQAAREISVPELRPAGPLGDAYAGRIDDWASRLNRGWTYGSFDVPDVRLWPEFGVHSSPSGHFIDVYCGDDTFSNPKYQFTQAILPAVPVVGRQPAGIFLTPSWYHNFYHWMVDILPRVELVGTALAEGIPVIIPHHISKPRQATLSRALAVVGHDDAPILEVPGGVHRFDRMVMPTRLSLTLDVSPRQRDFMRRMMLPIAERKSGRKRIYVSRRDAKIRRVVNEPEIESILRARGFETIVLSELSPAAQAGAFHDAEAVIGHHGAAFANLAYCERGAVLIEFFQEGHFSPSYIRMAQLAEMTYGFGVGNRTGQDTLIDPAQLTDLLDRAGL
jgi:hypothetical protein